MIDNTVSNSTHGANHCQPIATRLLRAYIIQVHLPVELSLPQCTSPRLCAVARLKELMEKVFHLPGAHIKWCNILFSSQAWMRVALMFPNPVLSSHQCHHVTDEPG